MRATYLGGNTNGFVHLETYDIYSRVQIASLPYANIYKPRMCICIFNANGNGFAAYQSLEEVLLNWKF